MNNCCGVETGRGNRSLIMPSLGRLHCWVACQPETEAEGMRKSGGRSGKGKFWFGLVGVLLVCLAAVPADAAKHRKPALSISVLSGRADLVSGGSALVAINLPRSD